MNQLAGLALLLLTFALPAFAQTPEPTSPDKLQQIQAALNSPARPLDHRLRDERREPTAIVLQASVEPGDHVLDVGAGGGYLALIFAALVGESGRVDIHNTPGWIAQFPSMDPERMANAITAPNVGFVTAPWDRIDGGTAKYDAIVMGQVYHDAVLEGADIDAMNISLFELLKPGGTLVIEDHMADPEMSLGEQVGLHRISEDHVIAHLTRVGFRLRTSTQMVSPHDIMRFNVFRPGLRGRTSRYVLAFEKPA